jgi:hypothetical protein
MRSGAEGAFSLLHANSGGWAVFRGRKRMCAQDGMGETIVVDTPRARSEGGRDSAVELDMLEAVRMFE